ncbi:hypothetical protein HNP84_007899 [Thermocatellispora tengchongensis]|uniref:Uncharacterized protein n=1 Tax=Thermocatellispora tengchongensis TaxID=1073253 RepID=A0A840PH34_9ACTN|nr:hypothetical protein [Thermocatellispora tengchongensis]
MNQHTPQLRAAAAAREPRRAVRPIPREAR